ARPSPDGRLCWERDASRPVTHRHRRADPGAGARAPAAPAPRPGAAATPAEARAGAGQAPVSAAPDLIAPVVAFRGWKVIDDRLLSPYIPVRWEGRVMHAVCHPANRS